MPNILQTARNVVSSSVGKTVAATGLVAALSATPHFAQAQAPLRPQATITDLDLFPKKASPINVTLPSLEVTGEFSAGVRVSRIKINPNAAGLQSHYQQAFQDDSTAQAANIMQIDSTLNPADSLDRVAIGNQVDPLTKIQRLENNGLRKRLFSTSRKAQVEARFAPGKKYSFLDAHAFVGNGMAGRGGNQWGIGMGVSGTVFESRYAGTVQAGVNTDLVMGDKSVDRGLAERMIPGVDFAGQEVDLGKGARVELGLQAKYQQQIGDALFVTLWGEIDGNAGNKAPRVTSYTVGAGLRYSIDTKK